MSLLSTPLDYNKLDEGRDLSLFCSTAVSLVSRTAWHRGSTQEIFVEKMT